MGDELFWKARTSGGTYHRPRTNDNSEIPVDGRDFSDIVPHVLRSVVDVKINTRRIIRCGIIVVVYDTSS